MNEYTKKRTMYHFECRFVKKKEDAGEMNEMWNEKRDEELHRERENATMRTRIKVAV
jgi:hypothetical protein